MALIESALVSLLEQLRDGLDLSRDDLARALDAHPRTVDRWLAGDALPQHDARRRLYVLLDLQRHLDDTFRNAEARRAWLHAESAYLGGLTPADALRVGRPDRVEAALEALDSGVFV